MKYLTTGITGPPSASMAQFGSGGISVGKHGKGHLGSVSPTRTVAGSTSALLTASRPVASGLALEMLGLSC